MTIPYNQTQEYYTGPQIENIVEEARKLVMGAYRRNVLAKETIMPKFGFTQEESDILEWLKPEDLANATFTISNLGMFDIDRFSAIINLPQSAILAIGKIDKRFVPGEDDLPIVKQIVTFTLSADHRVMDGVQAAKFLKDLKSIISYPEEMEL